MGGVAAPLASGSHRGCSPRCREPHGFSQVETLVVLAVLALVVSQVVPTFVGWRQQQRLEAAVRQLAQQLNRACSLARASGRSHGLALVPSAGDMGWALFADGDGDGIGQDDVLDGADPRIDAWTYLRRRFPGVEPGRPGGVPTVAGGAADVDGLAFGNTGIVSCSATGGARSGTLYLKAETGSAAALRVYGPTARLTAWWWRSDVGSWVRLW